MKIRAAVVEAGGAAPTIEAVTLASPRDDEVLVRVVATGVCHTDVAWADGALFDEFPVVLGHESAGIVEAVGRNVTRVRPGDRVCLALAHHCGHCRYCESGRPMLCGQRVTDPGRMSREGQPLVQGFGTAGFAEHALVREASVIPVPSDVPLKVAAVVGCAVSTGLGAVTNIAAVDYGSTVAVHGAGAVGLSVVMGCRLVGAAEIVVVDPNPTRREAALAFGATAAVGPDEDALRAICPDGFSYVFESAGNAAAMQLAIRVTERGGTTTLIGAPPPGVQLTIDALDFVPSQRRILGCLTGNVRPNIDFDRYFRLYGQGRLDLDRLVTGAVPFADIGRAFELNRSAAGLRTVVEISTE